MDLSAFKDSIVHPLKTTIQNHKSPTLAQISSRDDLMRQWDRAEGMQMALTHIENVYASTIAAQPIPAPEAEFVQEILPPQ